MSVQSGSGKNVEELTITSLPPLPKLRLKPGLFHHPKLEHKPPVQNEEKRKKKKNELVEQKEEEEKTSRLLMKSECRSAGGRRKNGSSLVHSIPKFSEVKKGKLSEVQKVLQSRLLSKQRLKQQQQQILQQQKQEPEEQLDYREVITPAASNSKTAPMEIPNHLQNLIYNQKISNPISRNSKSSSCSSPPAKVRRGRKLDKREITHVLKVNAPNLPYPILPHLSEVTITPKVIYTPNPPRHVQHHVEEALDLRTPGRVSPLPSIQSNHFMHNLLSREEEERGYTKRKFSGAKATSSSNYSDLNPETTIRKFKFTSGEPPCLEEQKPAVRYILDPQKRSNFIVSGDLSTPPIIHPRINEKMGTSSFHSSHNGK